MNTICHALIDNIYLVSFVLIGSLIIEKKGYEIRNCVYNISDVEFTYLFLTVLLSRSLPKSSRRFSVLLSSYLISFNDNRLFNISINSLEK